MNNTISGRVIGILILAAFPLYGVGQFLFDNGSSTGILLILFNSMVVVTIGVLFYPMLKSFSEHTALGYLSTRILEGIFLGVGLLLPTADQLHYLMGMFVLGIGSVFLCYTLVKSAAIPKWLGQWGVIGYALLSIGCVTDILGMGLGTYLLIPGGLFELYFSFWMILKGINRREP